MRDFTALLALPASLLALLTHSVVNAQGLSPPDNLARAGEYSDEHQRLIRREWEAAEKLAWQAPIGVKKMSGDPDEKFFLHYWSFEGDNSDTPWGAGQEQELVHGNASMLCSSIPGIVPHFRRNRPGLELFARSIFARDFHCPGNTHSCINSIDAEICCHPNQECVMTANGPGCCPDGETCGDTVGTCTGGETSCQQGCCIAGAVCEQHGCVIYGTRTTTALRTVTRTSGSTARTVTGSGSTVTVFQPTTIRVTTTTTVQNGKTTTKTSTLGSTQDTTTNTRVSPNRPILPTSVSASTASSSSNSNCLAGYYQCSAHFLGGCCKIGRNCDTTHCPPTGSTITIGGGGVTIVQSGPTSVRGTCDNGLFSCPASVNGGCCPSGFRCGAETCLGRNGDANTAKSAPSSATVLQWAGGFTLLALTAGIGMIWL